MSSAPAIAGNCTSVSWWTMLPLAAQIGSSTNPDVGGSPTLVVASNCTGSGAVAAPAASSAAEIVGVRDA